MKPLYSWWKDIGIYQRNLTNYDVSTVLHGRSFGSGCLNCHSFVGNDPKTMTICLRSATYGSDTLLARNGSVEKIGAKWGYTAWHPSGRLAVYSINKVTQFFHAGGMEVRDVADLDSALVCYQVESGKAVSPKELADKDKLETYPTWSPDGKYLYFCSAPVLWKDRNAVPPENFDKLQYDLRRIPYDLATDQWGKAETVLSAAETGRSILLPRISPDGRFLVFCMCQYGCFPVYQPSSDLYLMDLATQRADITSSPSTASSPNRGTVGPATAGGSPSAASVKTACSPEPTSATLTRRGRRTSPLSCRRKTRRTTIRCSRRTASRNWSAGRSRWASPRWPVPPAPSPPWRRNCPSRERRRRLCHPIPGRNENRRIGIGNADERRRQEGKNERR